MSNDILTQGAAQVKSGWGIGGDSPPSGGSAIDGPDFSRFGDLQSALKFVDAIIAQPAARRFDCPAPIHIEAPGDIDATFAEAAAVMSKSLEIPVDALDVQRVYVAMVSEYARQTADCATLCDALTGRCYPVDVSGVIDTERTILVNRARRGDRRAV